MSSRNGNPAENRGVYDGNGHHNALSPSKSMVGLPLSPRERQVLDLFAQGRSNREVAQQLGISYMTVKQYAHNIYHKLDVRNRVAAVLWATQHANPKTQIPNPKKQPIEV